MPFGPPATAMSPSTGFTEHPDGSPGVLNAALGVRIARLELSI